MDCERVAEYVKTLRGVTHSIDYPYMCSEPGQVLIKEAITEHRLTGVVVGSCSPRMHESTFRRAVSEAGLNPFLCEMANLREHCSWVHPDREEATLKAMDLVRLMVEKVKRNHSLYEIKVPVTKRALVIGGGVAGIQAALDIAAGGQEVILVEREPSIGGHMSQLDETFPTLDCSQCILTPKMVDVAHNPKIKLMTYSEVESVDGYIGNFEVKIRKKARMVDEDKCTGCGICTTKCPKKRPSEWEMNLGERRAIYVPFKQAVPNIPVLDKDNCRYFAEGKCQVCKKLCPRDAIDYEQTDEIIKEKVGAIVAATGYKLMDPSVYEEYGYGKYPDIITGLEFERLVNASGPTKGELRRRSDGEIPKTIVFIQCVGSRDETQDRPYCSGICCMYTAKHAMLYKHKYHDGKVFVFYIDIRATGKNYEEFTRRAIKEDKATYLRGRVSKIYENNGKLIVRGADTLSGAQVEIKADMVVLATAMVANDGAEQLAQKLRISYDRYHFFTEAHPKLKPVETNTAGVFLAGACQSPKDIPESVSMGSAAAAKVLGLLSSSQLTREPIIGVVNEETCAGCFDCELVCAYEAVERKDIRDKDGTLVKMVARINEGMCQGCGTCSATCRSNSLEIQGFNDEQIYAEINAL